ncbi:MAG: hypothetical protein V4510_10575 [bacterium]
MTRIEAVTLPAGLWVDETCHRTASIVAPSGLDEVYAQDVAGLPMARQVSGFLARCVVRIGDVAPVTPAIASRLTVGDREALLLRLRILACGSLVQSKVECPQPTCGQAIDVEIDAMQLLSTKTVAAPPLRTRRNSLPVMEFRLPTGEDQEAVAAVARHDPQRAALEIARRCIVPGKGGRVPSFQGARGRRRLAHLADAMATEDPQAETMVGISCPACGGESLALLDAGAYVLGEMRQRARLLQTQVHEIALHYHWAERDILAMPPGRRESYLALLHGQGMEGGRP